jgi:hypothetical protein
MAMIRRALNRLGREVTKLASALTPDKRVTFRLDTPLSICLPYFNKKQLELHLAGLPWLSELAEFGPTQLTFLTIAGDSEANLPAGASYLTLPDYRSLFSFLTTTQSHVVVPDFVVHDTESLREWCAAYHVHYYDDMASLVDFIRCRGPLTLSGPLRPTQAVFRNFSGMTRGGGQYGFTEPLRWDVIQKLPLKFCELSKSAEINAYSIELLQGPLGRLERQRSIGRLYREFFQGKEVLDLGCDVRGIQEFVGPNTRYCGADIHGKPDVLVNLDLDSFPFAERSFDTIVCIEVLEHLNKMHKVFDDIMRASRRYVVCSLPNEFSSAKNRFMDYLGMPTSSANIPVAPVFDRHEWLGGLSDGMDFLYYRATLGGFKFRRVDLFYFQDPFLFNQADAVISGFRAADIYKLNKTVGTVVTVLERTRP